MVNITRRQLTLFIEKTDSGNIESIRHNFNPIQSGLINCHVTLCREDEIKHIDQVLNNLEKHTQKPINIHFGEAIRFNNGKGVLIPGLTDNKAFHEFRQQILKGSTGNSKRHEPHITLMHPRNSTCTDEIFKAIRKFELPTQLNFKIVSLIEQVNGSQWDTLKTFNLLE